MSNISDSIVPPTDLPPVDPPPAVNNDVAPPPVTDVPPPVTDIPPPVVESEQPIQPPPVTTEIPPPDAAAPPAATAAADSIPPPAPIVSQQPPAIVEPIQPPPVPSAEPAAEANTTNQTAISETVIVHVCFDDKRFKIRIAREMIKTDHVKDIACRLFHLDPLKIHLLDEKTNNPMDDIAITDMAVNPAVTEIFTKLGEGTGMVSIVLNVKSLSKPVAAPVPFDMFMPTCSLFDVSNSLTKRNEPISQPLGFTGLAIINQDGMTLQDSDNTVLEKVPQSQENTITLDAAPLEELQDVNIADMTNGDAQRSINVKLHLPTTADIITKFCAKIWEFSPDKCILQVLTAEGGFTLDPTTTVQSILSSGQTTPVVTSKPGSLSLLFQYFEPLSLNFWFSGDQKVEVVLKEGLQTAYVKAQAAAALHIYDAAQWALVQHGTGRVIVADKIDIDKDGKDFELVLVSSLTTIVAPMEDPNLPQASVQYYPVTESSSLTVGEFLAAIPKPQPDSELALFVNGIEAPKTLPVSSLGGGEQTSVIVVDLTRTNMTLLNVSVTSEKSPDSTCKFKVSSTVSAQDVRLRAASLLNMENATEALLSDKEGCIIDDLCAMSDMEMETYDFVLLD